MPTLTIQGSPIVLGNGNKRSPATVLHNHEQHTHAWGQALMLRDQMMCRPFLRHKATLYEELTQEHHRAFMREGTGRTD